MPRHRTSPVTGPPVDPEPGSDRGDDVRQTRVVVALPRDGDPQTYAARHAAGQTWDASPYGYQRADAVYPHLAWFRDRPVPRGAGLVERVAVKILGFGVLHVWSNRSLLAEADVVWTHREMEYLPLVLLRTVRPRRYTYRVLGQTVWLWDRWPSLPWRQRRIARALLRRLDLEITHSRDNQTVSARTLGDGHAVHRVPFGTQLLTGGRTDIDLPVGSAPDERPLVLAPGNDRHRDWSLLVAAARLTPQLEYVIASHAFRPSADLPTNLRVFSPTRVSELADLYARAACVALPLAPNLHASGLTTAVEALSAGVPLVATNAGGLDEYLDGVACLVPVGDAAAFARALALAAGPGRAHRDPGAASAVAARGLTQADYVARYVALTEYLLGRAPWDERVTSLTPMGPRPAG